MMLNEATTVADAVLPLDAFKAHLRLGTGFGDDSLQDEVLISFLRAAIAAVEARTGRVLLARDFTWTFADWQDRSGVTFPVAPVSAVASVEVADAAGIATVMASTAYVLRKDSIAPQLRPAGSLLPQVPVNGGVTVAFTAGMGAVWADLPADLAQAVLLLAAHYYEYRNETALTEGCMPFGVSSLLQRYRRVRLSIGAGQ